MPTVLRIGKYRFHFYSGENTEPPHIHVQAGNCEAKFWLRPVRLARNYGHTKKDLREIARLVKENCAHLIKAYIKFHGRS
jgi:hypothetical protein